MNVGTALETNTEAPEVMQPGMRAFNKPSIFATAAAMCGTVPGHHRLDAAIARCPSMPLGVVAAIGVDHARALQWMAAQSAHRRNGIAA